MKDHGLLRDIMREWTAPAEDKRQGEDHVQRIANAFFFSVTIFALALRPRREGIGSPPSRHPQLHELFYSCPFRKFHPASIRAVRSNHRCLP